MTNAIKWVFGQCAIGMKERDRLPLTERVKKGFMKRKSFKQWSVFIVSQEPSRLNKDVEWSNKWDFARNLENCYFGIDVVLRLWFRLKWLHALPSFHCSNSLYREPSFWYALNHFRKFLVFNKACGIGFPGRNV